MIIVRQPKIKSHANLKLLAAIILLALFSPKVARAADITVGTGCTLAQAIESANTDTVPTGSSCTQGDGDDTITIAADITLSADLPAITSNITINGGSNSISGNDARRIFSITGGAVAINNLTMTNGSVSTGNYGGAVSVTGGAATINNSTITNTASGGGGALYVNGSSTTVTVSNSVISDNTISDTVVHGAGIRVEGGATLTITGSSITGNTRADFAGGGAMYLNGNFTVSISNSYIADNSGTKGAAMIISDGNTASSAAVTNSTIYNNRALGSSATDAGIRIEDSGGTYTFKHITLSNNFGQAPTAGNQLLVTTSMDTGGSVILANSLLDDAKSGVNDCHVGSGTNFTNGGNLIADGSCSAATSGDPLLGALTGSGAGRHLPLGDMSPAIGAGADDYCDDLSTDQIGTARPTASCDVGAVENTLSMPLVADASEDSPQLPQQGASTPPANDGDDSGGASSSSPSSSAASQTAIPTAAALTCENLNGIIVKSQHGFPQCNTEESVGGDVVANLDIAQAGGYIDAVDVWDYLADGAEVCFALAGELVFLDAATSPRTLYRLPSYTGVNGMTCAFIDRAGTVVLMNPTLIPPQWSYMPGAPAPPSSSSPYQTLTGCLVRTEHDLFFRASPGGETIPPQTVPAAVTLTALERADGWFKVDYHGAQGWISAAHVTPQGNCG